MSSKGLIFSGDSGPRASRPRGAPPSGVRPNSLVNKTLLPASSHFYAHPHPFPTDGAIPRTLVMCLCLLKTPRLNPGVAHATLHRRFRHCASLFCILRARSCIQFAPPHHEKSEHSMVYDQQVPTQKSRRAASPRFIMPPVHACLRGRRVRSSHS